MKFKYFLLAFSVNVLLASCSSSRKTAGSAENSTQAMNVTIDLVNINEDRVMVTVKPTGISGNTLIYRLPKIIPGTYAIADYGRYVDDFEAYDKNGQKLAVTKLDVNTWSINNATTLEKISYWVNDTYDNEGKVSAFEKGSTTIFSPAGTNILEGKQFMLNLAGFVGYFSGYSDVSYRLSIMHPENITGVSAMVDEDPAAGKDFFVSPRFADLMDSPIMYAEPDISKTKIGPMELQLSVYSPLKKSITSAALFPDLEKMIKAQKKYLGNINNTQKYVVLNYVTSMEANDAQGIGALEHNASTTGVFQATMRSKDLVHVIAHEFFHTLAPLNVHSKEIHNFDFNSPKMSQHLWFYEGITEFFAQHFQVHEGLKTEDQFLNEMNKKINNSRTQYRDSLSFTEMSKNVLDPVMKAQYPNVYEKGALIAMCLDIILREKSAGKSGILELMGRLAKKYGPTRPFNDDDLIPEITAMTYPEVGDFLQKHVVTGSPIDFNYYFAKVGVTPVKVMEPTLLVFLVNNTPYISIDTAKRIVKVTKIEGNNFYAGLGVELNDEILEINEIPLDASDITKVFIAGLGFEEGEDVLMKVKRNGREVMLKGKARLNYVEANGYRFTDQSKASLKNAWLKG